MVLNYIPVGCLWTFLLFRDCRSEAQQYWIRLHSSFTIVRATHSLYTRFLRSYGLIASFPRCTAGSNIIGKCCIRLHTTANTDATTPTLFAQQHWELTRRLYVALEILSMHVYQRKLNICLKYLPRKVMNQKADYKRMLKETNTGS